MKNKKRNKLFIIILMVVNMLLSNSSLISAAEMKELNCYGLEKVPINVQDDINNSLKNVSYSVINLYNILGGKVYFDEGQLIYNGISEDVVGLYYEDYEIHIATNEELFNNPNINYSEIIVHELGHFIYQKTYNLLSEKSKQTLQENYNYWKGHTLSCYDKNETFAEMYVWHCKGSANIDSNTEEMYLEVERICEELCMLYKSKLK